MIFPDVNTYTWGADKAMDEKVIVQLQSIDEFGGIKSGKRYHGRMGTFSFLYGMLYLEILIIMG